LKSRATTGIFSNILSDSKGKDYILLSKNKTKLSIPEDVNGKPDSYKTICVSAGFPLPPFAGGALAGAFLSSFFGSAALPPLAPAAY
jgi:uncharacterized membrane protein YoaK (UPF0700 family)